MMIFFTCTSEHFAHRPYFLDVTFFKTKFTVFDSALTAQLKARGVGEGGRRLDRCGKDSSFG